MTTLLQTLQDELLAARKLRLDEVRIELLKVVINRAEAEGKKELRAPTEAEVLDAIKYYSKGAKETVALMAKGGMLSDPRFDVARREVDILAAFLPTQIGDPELLASIREIGLTNIGLVMKGLKAKYGDSFDAARAKQLFTKETS
jgi:uncharacterized protein YqeY